MIYHFTAHTISCVCHSIRSMSRVLGIYNFVVDINYGSDSDLDRQSLQLYSKVSIKLPVLLNDLG